MPCPGLSDSCCSVSVLSGFFYSSLLPRNSDLSLLFLILLHYLFFHPILRPAFTSFPPYSHFLSSLGIRPHLTFSDPSPRVLFIG